MNWKRILLDIALIGLPEIFRLINNWVDGKKAALKEEDKS